MRLPDVLVAAAIAKWERSQAFRPGPVTYPVRLELNEKDFPQVWTPEGYSLRIELIRTAEALEAKGLASVRRTGRGTFSTPKAVVLSSAVVEAAYEQTEEETLRSHLSNLLAGLDALPNSPVTWVSELLERIRAEAESGRTRILGRGAKDPSARTDLLDALRLVIRIAERRPYLERTLGGEMFGATKRLRDLRPRVRQFLLSADPHWARRSAGISDRDLFSHYGEIFKPPFTAVALGFRVPQLADFAQFRPYAQLPNPLLARVAESVAGTSSVRWVTTIENESAFLRYLEEPGVWDAVARSEDVVLYTEGYATEAVCAFVATLCQGGAKLRHWGDTDSYGVQIALLLVEAAGRASLFRSNAEWVRDAPSTLGQPLTPDHREQLAALQADPRLDRLTGAREMLIAGLERGMWWEQEVFYASRVPVLESHHGGLQGTRM